VKTTLSNHMDNAHLSNRLICYVKKEKKVTNDDVVDRFMNMEGKGRRFDLNFSMIHYIHCFLL
jgi:hypothetical protein